MSKLWLLIDADNLAHRAFYTTGQLAEGTLFGIFHAILVLQDRFDTDDLVFCFDAITKDDDKRRAIHPQYKITRQIKRKEMTREERQERRSFRNQKEDLRDSILAELGYRNVFHAAGYEADDVIASVSKQLPDGDEAVVVSSDQDLFQLINGRVRCYNPITHVELTLQGFKAKYGILPGMWCDVKAIAGCRTDDVLGIVGIGEKRACDFLSHKMKLESNFYRRITFNSNVWQANLPLVRLPFDGCPEFPLAQNEVMTERWAIVMDRLGMPTLRDALPTGRRPRQPKMVARYAPKRSRSDE